MIVAVVTPNAADNALAAEFLKEERIETRRCVTLGELIPLIGPDVGCVVLVEEALIEPDVYVFHAALHAQPPWSDLPLLLIAAQGS